MDQALIGAELWSADDCFGDVLKDYRAKYVRSLPHTCSFAWEGLNVYLAHGAPWSDTDHVFPNVSEKTCRRIFATTGADIVVLGHTHIPMRLQFHDKWILNPGALCGNRQDLKQTCGILELPQAEFELFDTDTNQPVELETVIILEGDL